MVARRADFFGNCVLLTKIPSRGSADLGACEVFEDRKGPLVTGPSPWPWPATCCAMIRVYQTGGNR